MLTCIHEIPIAEESGSKIGSVPLQIRSVTEERSNIQYKTNNTRNTENNRSFKSYGQGKVVAWKGYGIASFSARCNQSKMRIFTFLFSLSFLNVAIVISFDVAFFI